MEDDNANCDEVDRAATTSSPFPAAHRGARTAEQSRARLAEAMLIVCGQRGYQNTSVQHAIEWAGGNRASFYQHFKNKEDCFAQAYEEASEWLYRRLIGAATRQSDCASALQAAISELLDVCASEPALARALVIEPHAARGRALARRNELAERLAVALDAGCQESRQARASVTATLTIGAMEALLRRQLEQCEAEPARDLEGALVYVVALRYLGEESARAETEAALSTSDAGADAAGEATGHSTC